MTFSGFEIKKAAQNERENENVCSKKPKYGEGEKNVIFMLAFRTYSCWQVKFICLRLYVSSNGTSSSNSMLTSLSYVTYKEEEAKKIMKI